MYAYVHFCMSRSVSVLLNRLLKVLLFRSQTNIISHQNRIGSRLNRKLHTYQQNISQIVKQIICRNTCQTNLCTMYHNFNFDLSPIKRIRILRIFWGVMSQRELATKEIQHKILFFKKRGKILARRFKLQRFLIRSLVE